MNVYEILLFTFFMTYLRFIADPLPKVCPFTLNYLTITFPLNNLFYTQYKGYPDIITTSKLYVINILSFFPSRHTT